MRRSGVWRGIGQLAAISLLGVRLLDGQGAGKPVAISVDLRHSLGTYTPIYSWFGYDEANYTTAPGGRRLLGELHDLSPVPVSIRAHHLLTSGDGVAELKWSSTDVYKEDAQGRPIYDFRILDGIFDAYRSAGVRPMVELGFMPKDLAATLPDRQQPYQVHYPANVIAGASNNPPKDYARWGELVRTVTAHLVERYGRENVRQWYFEVWNEPDIDYWHASPQEYWKLYDYAVAGVRAALPEARVGGPASTGPGNAKANAFLRGFLNHVSEGKSAATGGKVPLDFISFHAKGHPTTDGSKVTMGIAAELNDVDKGFAVVASFPAFRRLPIILSEADPEGCAACSSKVNPANNYRNGTIYPAYTAAAYKALFDLAERHGVNLLAMLSWSFEFEGKEYFEGFRSLSTNGVDKPVLNFFRMAALMNGDRVEVRSSGALAPGAMLAAGARGEADVDAMATRGEREAAVLLWNYYDLEEPAAVADTTINVHGLPSAATRVLVEEFRIDSTHSNSYEVWKAMGSPQRPSEEQFAELKRRDGLELLHSPVWMDVHDGQIAVQDDLSREAVGLIRVHW